MNSLSVTDSRASISTIQPNPLYLAGADQTSQSEPIISSDKDSKALLDSIALVLSAKGRKTINSGELTEKMRINEEELYSAIILKRLTRRASSLAAQLVEALPEQIKKIHTNKGSIQVFKATDRIMRRLVKGGQISRNVYRRLRNFAFGKAQLDSDRSWLSTKRSEDQAKGDTPLRTLATALSKYQTNSPASPEEIRAFRARQAEISRAKRREGQGVLHT